MIYCKDSIHLKEKNSNAFEITAKILIPNLSSKEKYNLCNTETVKISIGYLYYSELVAAYTAITNCNKASLYENIFHFQLRM